MTKQNEPDPAPPLEVDPLGDLLRALRERARLAPAQAASKLRRHLRERLVQAVVAAKIRDWEAGYGYPDPVVLDLYLEALEAPQASLERVEAALRGASALEAAKLGRLEPGGALGDARETPEQTQKRWQRAKVRMAAEELRWAASSRSLFGEARRLLVASAEPAREAAGSRSRK